MFDFARNVAPFRVVVQIEVINDNVPVLMLDGTNMEVDYNLTYFERQPYLPENLPQVFLSRGLEIADIDVGEQLLVGANITLMGGKSGYTHSPVPGHLSIQEPV